MSADGGYGVNLMDERLLTTWESHRHAVERILEDETPTADLTAAAQSLLDWGLARAKAIAQQAEYLSPESLSQLDAHLAALRRTMKRIGQQVGDATPEVQMEQVQILLVKIEIEQNLEAEIDTIHDPEVAALFVAEFGRVYEQARTQE